MLSKRKSISQSLFHVHYLGQTPVDRRCAVSVLPWIIEELKLKLGDQEEINLMWLTPGPEGVSYVANNGQEKLNHAYQNIVQCCKAADEVSFAYIMKGQKDPSYACHVFQALTPDEASMITQQLQDRARNCASWTDLRSGSITSSSNLLAVPGSLGSQSLPSNDEYSLEYAGCLTLDSGLQTSATLDKVVRKLRDKRKKAQGQLRKKKGIFRQPSIARQTSVAKQPSIAAQAPEEANTVVDSANSAEGGTFVIRSGITRNGDIMAPLVATGDARKSRSSDSSSEGGGGGGKEAAISSLSAAESSPSSSLSPVLLSGNDLSSPKHSRSLASGFSMTSVTGPGQEEDEEAGDEGVMEEDATFGIQWEETTHSSTTLCQEKAEGHSMASTSGTDSSQPVIEVNVEEKSQLFEGSIAGYAERKISVGAEALPLASSEVDNLQEVDNVLNSTLAEAVTDMPSRKVRLVRVGVMVSVYGEPDELLLRWSLKTTAICVQGKENPNFIALIGREQKPKSYVCHTFKTADEKEAEEIVESFKACVVNVLSQDLPAALCDNCPLQELHRLCEQLEGASTQVAQAKLQNCLDTLSESHYDSLVKQYKAAKTENEHIQIVLLVSLFRRHFQQEQLRHTHGTEAQSILKESDSVIRTGSFNGTTIRPPRTLVGKLLARKKLNKALKDAEGSDDGKGQASNGNVPRPHSPIFSRKSDLKTLLSPVSQTVEPTVQAEDKLNVDEKLSADEKVKGDEKKAKKSYFWSKSRDNDSLEMGTLESSIDSGMKTATSLLTDASELEQDVLASATMNNHVPSSNSEGTLTSFALTAEDPNLQQEFKVPTTPIARKKNLRLRTPPSSGPFSTPSSASNTPFRVGHRRTTSLRQQIFESIATPAKVDVLDQRTNLVFERRERTNSDVVQSKARHRWKKAIKKQIELNQLERLSPRVSSGNAQLHKLAYEDNDINVLEATQMWRGILSTSKCSDETIKAAMEMGVPPTLRGQVWEFLINRYHNCKRPDFNFAPFPTEEYNRLCQEQTEYNHVIKIDLGRSFPKHPYFNSACSEGQQLMQNVLHAYAVLDKEVGYCQGLSFVAGIIVMHAKDEETAFWMFTQLLRLYNHREVYLTVSFYHLQVRLYQLSRLLHDYYPVLHSHLQKYEVPPFLYAAPWFLALFASQFSIAFSSRLMDLHFYDGGSALFKISLSLFEQYQEDILEFNTMESILNFLKVTMPSLAAKDIQVIFKRALEYNLGNKLETFETEYDVIEDLTASFNMDGVITDMETMQDTLRKQNKELIEQLAICHTSIRKLEATVTSLLATINAQDQRIQRLEGKLPP